MLYRSEKAQKRHGGDRLSESEGELHISRERNLVQQLSTSSSGGGSGGGGIVGGGGGAGGRLKNGR